MSLLLSLQADMKVAMKARDAVSLTTIRGMIADIKKLQIDTQKEMNEAAELSFLSTQAKRRRESIEAFRKGGRDDLADNEEAELAIIEKYLPAQLSEEEARAEISKIIESVGATSKKDFGRVMGASAKALKGRFPGKDVKALVEGLLD